MKCVLLALALLSSCSLNRGGSYSATTRAVAAERDSRRVIVAFGDSLTAGLGVPPDESYPSKLQLKIDEAGYRYRVVNQGVSGDTTSQALSRIDAALQLHPAIAIIELGLNDRLRGIPVEETAKNLDTIVESFKEALAEVVLAAMPVPPQARIRDLVLITSFLDGVEGHPEMNQADGMHPAAAGYDIIVDNVWKELEPLLVR